MDNYNWPKGAQIEIIDDKGNVLCKSNDHSLDLSDNLMANWDGSVLNAVFSLSRGERELWTDDYLKEIENLIEYDLSFDGFKVDIKRLSSINTPCDQEYYWKLEVDVDDADDDDE